MVNAQLLPVATVLLLYCVPIVAGVLFLLSLAGKIYPRTVPVSHGLALVNI
jgi:hypothetical protein